MYSQVLVASLLNSPTKTYRGCLRGILRCIKHLTQMAEFIVKIPRSFHIFAWRKLQKVGIMKRQGKLVFNDIIEQISVVIPGNS